MVTMASPTNGQHCSVLISFNNNYDLRTKNVRFEAPVLCRILKSSVCVSLLLGPAILHTYVTDATD